MRLQPGQDIRPASVAGACTLTREARVGQTNRRGATLLLQIDAHEALRRVLLPVGKPCKGEQTRSIDLGVYSEIDRPRSEEHTSELQSHSDLVCRLLLEKKKEKHEDHTIQ